MRGSFVPLGLPSGVLWCSGVVLDFQIVVSKFEAVATIEWVSRISL